MIQRKAQSTNLVIDFPSTFCQYYSYLVYCVVYFDFGNNLQKKKNDFKNQCSNIMKGTIESLNYSKHILLLCFYVISFVINIIQYL